MSNTFDAQIQAARAIYLDTLDIQFRSPSTAINVPSSDVRDASSWLSKARRQTAAEDYDKLDEDSRYQARTASEALVAEAVDVWEREGASALTLPSPAAGALIKAAGFEVPPLVIDDLICSVLASLVLEQLHAGDGATTSAEERAVALAAAGSLLVLSWRASRKRRGPERRGIRAQWRQ